ncbi:MAG: hypothetical protein WC717_05135 [Candidatus Micrarchaeia archaeon]|jgi:hypothetical protein
MACAFKPRQLLEDGSASTTQAYSVRKDGILTIIGEGEIGDKARSLDRDAEGYRKAGLVVDGCTVFAQEVLEDFLKFNGICNTLEEGNAIPDIQKRILEANRLAPAFESAYFGSLAAFPTSGIEKIEDRMPKKRHTGLGLCHLHFESFRSEASQVISEAEIRSIEQEFEKLRQAASLAEGWISGKPKRDGERTMVRKEKEVELTPKFVAVLHTEEVISSKHMEYYKKNPQPVYFELYEKVRLLPAAPGIARSSAKGDDDGTGAYSSKTFANTPTDALEAFKTALSSYYGEMARDLRQSAKTGEGYGIMLQPICGSVLQVHGSDAYFFPLFSGVALIEPGKRPLVGLSFGFGGVVDGGGEILDYDEVFRHKGAMSGYIHAAIERANGRGGQFDSPLAYDFFGQAARENRKEEKGGLDHVSQGLMQANVFSLRVQKMCRFPIKPKSYMDRFDLRTLYSNLEKAAETLGKRRVEFAVVLGGSGGQPQCSIHLLQSSIPESTVKKAKYSVPDGKMVSYVSDMVGSVDFEYKKIFRPVYGGWHDQLQDYEKNIPEGYVLLIQQDFTSHENKIYLRSCKGVFTYGEAKFEYGSGHYSAARMLEHFSNFSAKTGRFVASSPKFPFQLGAGFLGEDIIGPIMSGISEKDSEKAFAEFYGKHGPDVCPNRDNWAAFLKSVSELGPSRNPYSVETLLGHDLIHYTAHRNMDGTIDFFKVYSFRVVEAPEGFHFHSVGNAQRGVRTYLCKDE